MSCSFSSQLVLLDCLAKQQKLQLAFHGVWTSKMFPYLALGFNDETQKRKKHERYSNDCLRTLKTSFVSISIMCRDFLLLLLHNNFFIFAAGPAPVECARWPISIFFVAHTAIEEIKRN